MALIHEEIKHESGVEIMVTERESRETREPWKCVSMDMGFSENLTPKELRALGKWLIQVGRRIGREYKSNGAPKSHNKEHSDR